MAFRLLMSARFRSRFCVAVGLTGLLVHFACAPTPRASSPASPAGPSFVDAKRSHRTVLFKRAPITEKPPTFSTPEGAQRIPYRSGDLSLFGWFAPPTAFTLGDPAPALLYLHGHFAMTPKDFARLAPLRDRGFAVFVASLRGRNGNPGAHELLFGEVDDAAAALRTLATLPGVDPTRLYAFGHSMGGGTAALLSLDPSVPVRLTGGCGAVYSTDTFRNWAAGADRDLVRFDPTDPKEARLRVLLPWAHQLAHPHLALMGRTERTTFRNAKRVDAIADSKFAIAVVDGNHSTALAPALDIFAAVIAHDAQRAPAKVSLDASLDAASTFARARLFR